MEKVLLPRGQIAVLFLYVGLYWSVFWSLVSTTTVSRATVSITRLMINVTTG